jgi:polyisoprenoid-binding protein YceI
MRPILIALLFPLTLFAVPQVYNFNDPKQVNTLSFTNDSTLEPFAGLVYGVGGTVTFDPDRPEQTTGRITVPAALVLVPNNDMMRTLQSQEWLDAAGHPEISFEIKRVLKVEKRDIREFLIDVEAELKIKGKTKLIPVSLRLTHLPDQVRERGGGREGDLLAVRGALMFRRSEFDIKTTYSLKKVADEISVQGSIIGYAGQPGSAKP